MTDYPKYDKIKAEQNAKFTNHRLLIQQKRIAEWQNVKNSITHVLTLASLNGAGQDKWVWVDNETYSILDLYPALDDDMQFFIYVAIMIYGLIVFIFYEPTSHLSFIGVLALLGLAFLALLLAVPPSFFIKPFAEKRLDEKIYLHRRYLKFLFYYADYKIWLLRPAKWNNRGDNANL